MDTIQDLLTRLVERKAEWEAVQADDLADGNRFSACHASGIRDGIEIAIEEVKAVFGLDTEQV